MSVERLAYKLRKKYRKKLSGNFGYIWGEVTPVATLTKCGDMVDVITCAIFGDCQVRGVGVVSLPSRIDLRYLTLT